LPTQKKLGKILEEYNLESQEKTWEILGEFNLESKEFFSLTPTHLPLIFQTLAWPNIPLGKHSTSLYLKKDI
jgi:hypothetical protein